MRFSVSLFLLLLLLLAAACRPAACGCPLAVAALAGDLPTAGAIAALAGDLPASGAPDHRVPGDHDGTATLPWRSCPEPLAKALALTGLSPSQFRVDADDASYFGVGRHRQQMYDVFMRDPLKIEPDTKVFGRTLLQGSGSASALVLFGTIRLREGVRRGLIGSPLIEARAGAAGPRPLSSAIEALDARGGRHLTVRERQDLERAAAAVPESIARPASLLIGVMADVMDWRDRAFRGITVSERASLHRSLLSAAAKIDADEGGSLTPLAEPLAGRIDFESLYAGATDLALAVDAALDGLPADPDPMTAPAPPAVGAASAAPAPSERALTKPARSPRGPGLPAAEPSPALPAEGLPALHGLRELASLPKGPDPVPPAAPAAPAAPPASAPPAGPVSRRLSFRATTPYGAIVISGDGNDRHEGPTLLLIDTGGNDTYVGGNGATAGPGQGVSVLIDLGGNDTYRPARGSRPEPSAGAGVLGYGYLIDDAGDDLYEGSSVTEGSGLFGVGLLIDAGGTDHYVGGVAAQGAGVYGVGLLSDLGGNDAYDCDQQCEGFGYVMGLGALVDRSGDDRYTANDTSIRFPSAQTPLHNSSLAQGFGLGRRADYSDGSSLAGGIGLLVDGSGSDVYSAGLFAQGAAYWYGVGLLDDLSGNDRYTGVWYVQGSAAHFGIGALIDEGGNDSYRATMNIAQGAGHDFSWGELIEESGDDHYEAPNLSLGGGNDNGVGFFWDRGGKDEYVVADGAFTSLGRANLTGPRGGLRDRMLSLGVFLDTGGSVDRYSRPFAGNGKQWTQRGTNESAPLESEKGVGIDR